MRLHLERHRSDRIGWLRAAVLGANDGIVSTASLVIGVAAAQASRADLLIAGVAGMAAGEYVSVSSQADTEQADLAKERYELEHDVELEREELAGIYEGRGLEPDLARRVADQLMAHDALGAHARDELGISAPLSARPVQAALASAASFAVGAVLPLLLVAVVPGRVIPIVAGASLVFLAGLGGLSAWTGGAPPLKAMVRVTFWGALAMALTAAIGAAFGTVV